MSDETKTKEITTNQLAYDPTTEVNSPQMASSDTEVILEAPQGVTPLIEEPEPGPRTNPRAAQEQLDREEYLQSIEEFSSGLDLSNNDEINRFEIIRAAYQMFLTRGYGRSSIEEIAVEAGVDGAILLQLFSSKMELLLQAVIEENRQFHMKLLPIIRKTLPPREWLKRYLLIIMMLGKGMPLTASILSGDRVTYNAFSAQSNEQNEQWKWLSPEFLASLLDKAAMPHSFTQEELVDRAQVILGFMFFAGLIRDGRVRKGMSMEKYCKTMVEILVDGIDGAPKEITPEA